MPRVDLAWCLGVLCTASGPDAQLAMLRELRRIAHPAGRIGLLVYVALTPRLDDPPAGNHFPACSELSALLDAARLAAVSTANAAAMPPPPPDWRDRTAAVERELQRRFGHTPSLAAASEQSDRIAHLLSSGQLTSQVLILRRG